MKVCWGKKIVCPLCKSMFYDMQKKELHCPYCKKKLKPADFQKKHRTYRKRINDNNNDLEDQFLAEKVYDFMPESFDDSVDDDDDIRSIDGMIKE